ncbi:MAG: leucine-rich repeat protein [Clostridiales bacterium]|nr:leucine-rich repeat protein [Clostridiales bacterium]
MNKRKRYYNILFGMFFMVLLFVKHSLVAQAASQSITLTVGSMRGIYDNTYSEGSKTWTVSDSSVITLENTGANTSRIVHANKVGSATITIRTVYTAWEPTYNAATDMWLSTPVSKISYFTYYVTVVEEGEATPPTINTIADNSDLFLSSKTCVVTGTVRDTLAFESSDPSVISVDGHGVLFAKSSGSATITITDPYGATKTVTVNVVTQEEEGYTPISSIEELKAIPSESSYNYYLTEDLDFSGYSDSFSITSFGGTFDGAGHTIKGYKNSTALFSKAQNATIRNLAMQDAVIDGNGNDMAAIVCTGNGCTISNCHTLGGTVKNTTNAGGVFTSLIDDYMRDGKIEFCTNSASVQGSEVAGGVAGHTVQEIRWCTNKGTVATTNTSSVIWGCAGGIVGLGLSEYNTACSNYYQPIRYCLNEGNIKSVTAGGIAGRLYGSTLDQCGNKGTISSLPATLSSTRTTRFSCTWGHLGGILGLRMTHYNAIGSYIRNCYNLGTIEADDTNYAVQAGGIAGYLTLSEQYAGASIQNTYSMASVTNTKKKTDSYCGGIAGRIYLDRYCGYTVINSYTNNSTPVGLYGTNVAASNKTSNVKPLTADERYKESNYIEFDFGNIWTITPDGSSLPYLAIQDKAYNGLKYIALHKHSFNEQGVCEDEECGKISIDKHADIEITPIDVTYSGEEQTASVNVTYQGNELTAGTDYEITGIKATAAGRYEVVVTGKGSYADSKSVTWEIRKKELIPSVIGVVSKTYDGTTDVPEGHTLAISLEGIVKDHNVMATAEFSYDDMNAGTGKTVTASNISLGGDDKDNYCLSTTTVSADVGTIVKRETSIAFNDYHPNTVYTGKALDKPTAEQLTITGADYEDVIFIWYKNSVAEENKLTKAPADAGLYVLAASVPETKNTKASSAIKEGITIAKADPEYTKPSNLVAVCGDTLSSVSLEGTGFSWEDDTVKLTADSDVEAAKQVERTAVYTPADTENYNILTNISLTATVSHGLSVANIGEGRHASRCKYCTFSKDSVACSGGEATCSSKAVCSVCHEAYGEIAAANHKWDSGKVTKAATCMHKGEKTFVCRYDKTHTKTEPIASDENAHDYHPEVIPPTCTSTGYTVYTCSYCPEHSYTGDEVPAKGHTYVNGVCMDCKDILSFTVGNLTYTVVTKEVEEKVVGQTVTGTNAQGNTVTNVAVSVKAAEGVEGELVIPASITTTITADVQYAVTEIEENGFADCGITAVTIPETVTKIDAGAFSGCANLLEVTFTGESAPTIIDTTIKENENITVNIPEGAKDSYVEAIGESSNIVEKHVHKVSRIAEVPATCSKTGMKEYYVCDNANTGCGRKFSNAEATEEIAEEDLIIPVGPGKHNYGSWMEYNERQHKRVCKNDSVHIDYADHAFGDWKVVTAVTEQTDGVETRTCKVCGYVETKVIAKISHQHTFIEKIDKAATATEDGSKHEECSVCGYKKESVSIPASGVPEEGTSLKDEENGNYYAVADSGKKQVKYTGPVDKNAEQVSVPAQVSVDGMTYTVIEIDKNAFTGCKKLTKVTIGKNVTTIGDKAFYNCSALTKITIPANVSKIGKQTFAGCKKLKTITIKTTKLTNKNVGSKAFKGIYAKATIKVPKSKLASYKKLLKSKGVSSKAKIKK